MKCYEYPITNETNKHLTIQQIADRMGVSVDTAHSRWYKYDASDKTLFDKKALRGEQIVIRNQDDLDKLKKLGKVFKNLGYLVKDENLNPIVLTASEMSRILKTDKTATGRNRLIRYIKSEQTDEDARDVYKPLKHTTVSNYETSQMKSDVHRKFCFNR